MDGDIALVARQPICDRANKLVGYELLFRGRSSEHAEIDSPMQATAAVSVQAVMDLGLDHLAGNVRAWINVPRNVLVEGQYRFLPADRVVLEVLESVRAEEGVLRALSEARTLGYQIALDDFELGPDTAALVDFVDIVKVDVKDRDRAQIERAAADLRRPRMRLLAEKVETLEHFQHCVAGGFDLFQGYYFARPNLVKGRRLPADRLSLVRLLAEIQDPNTPVERIEMLVSANVGLGVRLLRYVNSAVYGIRKEIESIHHAIMMLGLERVRACVTMLLLAGIDDKPSELVTTALVRARYCQILGERMKGAPQRHFTAGLLSVLDAFLDQPMSELVSSMSLAPDLAGALVKHEGPLGETIEVALASEHAEWDRLDPGRWEEDTLRSAYLEALVWTAQIQSALGAN